MQSSWPFSEEVPLELCLEFVNTVSYRRSSDRRQDWLKGNEELLTWFNKRGLVTVALDLEDDIYQRALRLREHLYAIFSASSAAREPHREEPNPLSEEFARAMAQARLRVENGETHWALDGLGESAESALWPIAISAGLLLASDMSSRVRECADDDCGWLFLDTSKNRSRKWCSMSDCGNLAKARRYYKKHRATR